MQKKKDPNWGNILLLIGILFLGVGIIITVFHPVGIIMLICSILLAVSGCCIIWDKKDKEAITHTPTRDPNTPDYKNNKEAKSDFKETTRSSQDKTPELPSDTMFKCGMILFWVGVWFNITGIIVTLAINDVGGIITVYISIFMASIGIYLIRKFKTQENIYYNHAAKDYVSMIKDYKKTVSDLAKSLQQINCSYMLDLPDLTKETNPPSPGTPRIVYADNPFSAFANAISPEAPSAEEFIMKSQQMLTSLLNEMQFSSEMKLNIFSYFMRMVISEVDDDIVTQIAESFGSELPLHLYFLKNKVNYELACLGYIMGYGMDYNDSLVMDEVTKIRIKRGYLKV